MSGRRKWLVLALLFLGTLLWRLPARWASALLPPGVSCEQATGTAWNGSCTILRAAGLQLQGLRWRLLPGEVLHGRLGAQLQLDDAEARGSATLLMSRGGELRVQDLLVELPLANHLFPAPTTGWNARLALNLPLLQWQSQQLAAARGTVQLRDLQQLQPHVDFGSYELVLADPALRAGRLVGSVHDTAAPLHLTGELQFSLHGDYEFTGSLAPAAGVSAEMQQALDSLGAPDAQGNRTISIAGSL